MNRGIVLASLTVGALIGGVMSASEATAHALACGPRDKLVETLEHRHGEAAHGRGLMGPKAMVELWRAPEDGPGEAGWTLVLTRPDGVSCIIASGSAWHVLPDAPKTLPGKSS
ncbi:MAG: hypothetical protein AAF899_06040 [Pseudomonadota bacterium]